MEIPIRECGRYRSRFCIEYQDSLPGCGHSPQTLKQRTTDHGQLTVFYTYDTSRTAATSLSTSGIASSSRFLAYGIGTSAAETLLTGASK